MQDKSSSVSEATRIINRVEDVHEEDRNGLIDGSAGVLVQLQAE